MEDMDFDDVINPTTNKEARIEKGLPTQKEKTKKRTKVKKVQQSFSIEKDNMDKVKSMARRLERSDNYVVDKLLEYCFEKGVKI